MPFGVPDNFFGDDVNYLPTFQEEDVHKIEHVIFDRVHFELRSNRAVLGKQDTTFLKLYNTAVQKGIDAKTLEDGILVINSADLRATFGVDIYTTGAPNPGVQWAQIKATWDGTTYWYQEPAIQGGAFYATQLTSQQCGTIGFGFAHVWNNAVDQSGDPVVPILDSRHIRFANPIVIQVVSA